MTGALEYFLSHLADVKVTEADIGLQNAITSSMMVMVFGT
jgi:hypothetical protein